MLGASLQVRMMIVLGSLALGRLVSRRMPSFRQLGWPLTGLRA